MAELMWLQVDHEDISIKCFSPQTSAPRWSGIFLHGAGESNKERGDALCTEMARRGMRTVAFDFSGWGDSSRRTVGSLQKRVDEAKAVIEKVLLRDPLPLIVMAFSMSGQVAIELLRSYRHVIRCLALFNPAIYDRDAITVPFGPEFSGIIRQPQSWKNADIASAFDGYSGKTLLVKSEYDDVIPPEVYQMITQAACMGSISELIIESASHQLGAFLNAHPDAVVRVAESIIDLLCGHENAPH